MLADFVKESTTTTGTGTLTLTAMTGYARFSQAFAVGSMVYYSIRNGNNFESGIGQTGASNTLLRITVKSTLSGGVYTTSSPAALNLSGNSEVIATPIHDSLPFIDNNGKFASPNTGDGAYVLQTPTFQNSWTNYGGAFQEAKYYKDAFGVVHLMGLVQGGTIGLSYPIFTLPSGYRPTARHIFTTTQNDALGRVDVQADGTVVMLGGATGWISLSGINFPAA